LGGGAAADTPPLAARPLGQAGGAHRLEQLDSAFECFSRDGSLLEPPGHGAEGQERPGQVVDQRGALEPGHRRSRPAERRLALAGVRGDQRPPPFDARARRLASHSFGPLLDPVEHLSSACQVAGRDERLEVVAVEPAVAGLEQPHRLGQLVVSLEVHGGHLGVAGRHRQEPQQGDAHPLGPRHRGQTTFLGEGAGDGLGQLDLAAMGREHREVVARGLDLALLVRLLGQLEMSVSAGLGLVPPSRPQVDLRQVPKRIGQRSRLGLPRERLEHRL
jgi:hypothetical protein